MWLASNAACVASGSEIHDGTGGGSPGGGGPSGAGGYVGAGTGVATAAATGGAGGTTTGDYTSPTTAVSSSSSTAASSTSVGASSSAASSTSSGMSCQNGTHITYGGLWKPAPNHPDPFDDVFGVTVGWDGACTPLGTSSYATLSNGWQPYFETGSGCVIALDPECPSMPPAPCTTRITYGPSWSHAPNHPADYDDVPGKITWTNNRACVSVGAQSYATLSNGWTPYFQGADACAMSFRYENCGGV